MTDFIYHNEDNEYYSLNESELNDLVTKAQPLYKDVCLISISLGIPTLLNALAETAKQTEFSPNWSIFLNFTIGIVGILFFFVFGWLWKQSHKSTKELLLKIKNKPKVPLNVGTSDVGALEELEKKVEKLENTPAKWG